MTDRLHRQTSRVLIGIAAGALLCAALAIVIALRWRAPLDAADAAAAAHDWTAALARYQEASGRLAGVPVLHRAVADAGRQAGAGELRSHFHLGDYAAVVDRAGSVDASPESHYWTAAALFAMSRAEESADARIDLLRRSSEEFREVLAETPADWDALYNYELVRRLYDELRKKPETPPRLMLELLRPQPKDGQKPVKRAG